MYAFRVVGPDSNEPALDQELVLIGAERSTSVNLRVACTDPEFVSLATGFVKDLIDAIRVATEQ